ncbi:MAG: Fe-S protein assembly co-chaperone HscB [Gallionella sp.]|nr:Fe-S protein assembly co-chaperone HscB [Gallionella sp.]
MSAADFDLSENYFQLFGLTPSFEVDAARLESAFRALQGQVHPDKSAHLSDADQRLAMQRSTLVNEAYQTLKHPIRRARYLLSQHGVDTQEETNTVMPVDFLIEQMEWREAVADAARSRDAAALEELDARMKTDTRELERQLAVKIDAARDYVAAADMVRKLRFMEKLAEEIDSAYDEIDR